MCADDKNQARRKWRNFNQWWHTTAVLFVVLVSGCTVKEDPELAEQRSGLLMSQEPEGVTTIEDAKKQLTAGAMVTVVGSADLEAFSSSGQNKKALMLVREILPNDHGHEAGHDPSSCPFCKRRMEAAAKAAVEFVGNDGKVLPYEVDKLFDLEQGDQVVIRGNAELDEGLDILKITASGIHVRDRQPQ